jgi:mediator of RNA polymerase II transcription subunit 6
MTASSDQDLTGVMWNDKVWLSYFPLNNSTVLDYFSLSQFYDRTCNNELIKMQRLDPALMATMDGIEYAVSPASAPPFFLITKSRRVVAPPSSLTLLAVYYIINGNAYQAPSAHSVLSSRVLQSLHHLRKSFDILQSHAVPTIRNPPSVTRNWDPPPTAAAAPLDAQSAPQSDAGTHERKAVDRVLYDLLDKNRRITAAASANAAASAAASAAAASADAPTTANAGQGSGQQQQQPQVQDSPYV